MIQYNINTIWPDELKEYLKEHRESDYLLVDVRQPEEYQIEHLPGARLSALNDLPAELERFPKDKDLIFYCGSGSRSRFASEYLAENGFDPQKIYNMEGGIMAWEEQLLSDLPRTDILANLDNIQDVMVAAIDLEKGAGLFYQYLIDKLPDKPFTEQLKKIAAMEMGHAKLIFNILVPLQEAKGSFEELYASLSGDILEGGRPLLTVCQELENRSGGFMINALEMAINIEYAAYDLYRTFADQCETPDMQNAFLTLAQAEKQHIEKIVEMFEEIF